MKSKFGNVPAKADFQLNLSRASVMPPARVVCPTTVTDPLRGQSCLGNEGLFYGHRHIRTGLGINYDGDIECDPRLVTVTYRIALISRYN
jgi:hypothetical protein